MIDRITNKTNLLEKALDAAWLRNEVISNNIANVNTPGFKRSYVRFEEVFSDSVNEVKITNNNNNNNFPIMKDSNSSTEPEIITDNFTSARKDGNNVDIDVEMAELAKNTIRYNTLVSQLSKQFSKIKMVLNDGRK